MASIIFDFDGTLVDSFDLIFDIASRYSSKYTLRKISKKDRKLARTKSLSAIIREDLNIGFHQLPSFVEDIKKDYAKEVGKVRIHDGLKATISELAKKHDLYILTSNSKESVKAALRKNKICCFKEIYSDSSLFGKSVILKRLMKKYNLKRGDCIYVGDETRDIEACRKANIRIIAVTWGFSKGTLLRRFEPDAIAHTPAALVRAVEKIINVKQAKKFLGLFTAS